MHTWLNTQLYNGIAHIPGIDCTKGWQMFTCDWKVTLVAITGSTVHAGWLLAPSRRHFLPLPHIPHISRPLNLAALEILKLLAIEISCYYYLRFLVRFPVTKFPCLISSNFTCMSVVVLEVVFPVSLETIGPSHLKKKRMTSAQLLLVLSSCRNKGKLLSPPLLRILHNPVTLTAVYLRQVWHCTCATLLRCHYHCIALRLRQKLLPKEYSIFMGFSQREDNHTFPYIHCVVRKKWGYLSLAKRQIT